MKFVIASLPRSGSTAVYRVLRSDPATTIAYEPTFFDLGTNSKKIRNKTSSLFRKFDGIKHVWDPNGWPFRNPDHISSLDVLDKSQEFILPNKTVLDCAHRIALLRRKNAFDRTLSDLWGQQTNLWGHDPHQPHDVSEVQQYRDAAQRHVPSAIDPDVFGWYMHNAEKWENAIIDGLPPSTTKTFFYEDLFASDISETLIPVAWHELAEWLGLKPDFSSLEVRQIISPVSKLNSVDIYERIPNFQELKTAFYDSGR